MTTPSVPPASREWWTRPAVVLPLVATIVVLVALLTPQASSGRFGDPRLSSHLAGSLGARVLADMAQRLGWQVVKRDTLPAPDAADGRTIHAVLAPVTPVTPSEAHRYLEAVRAGDAMLLVLERRTPLADSLGVAPFSRGGVLQRDEVPQRTCTGRRGRTPPLWADGKVHLLGVRWRRPEPSGQIRWGSLVRDEVGGPARPGYAAVGFPFGNGRIVVVADPDLLRNDVLRHCPWGADVISVQMLEWLRAGGPVPRTTLAFDEYHQGFGSRSSVSSVVFSFLGGHPFGRMLLQVIVAGLVLLLAVSPRAIVPQTVERIERRDPLEQVDALAHAYEQVRATRTLTARLLHGLRWRVERGSGARTRADDAFLDAALARAPALRDDVHLVRRALRETIDDREIPEIGAALRRIEHTLTTTPA